MNLYIVFFASAGRLSKLYFPDGSLPCSRPSTWMCPGYFVLAFIQVRPLDSHWRAGNVYKALNASEIRNGRGFPLHKVEKCRSDRGCAVMRQVGNLSERQAAADDRPRVSGTRPAGKWPEMSAIEPEGGRLNIEINRATAKLDRQSLLGASTLPQRYKI